MSCVVNFKTNLLEKTRRMLTVDCRIKVHMDLQANKSLVVARESKEITDLESLDHAYVIAPNKIDEYRKANLIKSNFKPSLPVRF
jgi:hypothetical protein